MPHLQVSDVTLYYEEPTGDGPPLVFLNGLVMNTRHWAPQRPLASRYRLVRYDQRNQGRSSVLSGFRYTELVDDLERVLDHFEIDRAVVCGLSYGSIVAKEFAIRARHRCEALILGVPVATFDTPLRTVYRLWRALLRSGDIQAFLASVTLLSYDRPWPDAVETQFVDNLEKAARYISGEQVLALLDSFNPDDVKNYEAIECPTLVVGASHDRIHAPSDAELIATQVTGAQLTMIDGNHALSIDRAEAFNQAVDEFLRTLLPR
ncbi:MAG: alpha/beta hydrolase [Myxococcota bacterium]